MKIYKNKLFHQWSKEEVLSDATLIEGIEEIEKGIYDANLGGCIYKKRMAIPGKGKRGSLRTIVAYKVSDKAIFIYGYAKNHKSNLSIKEEQALKKLAKIYFAYGADEINKAVHSGELIEVYDEKNNSRNRT